MKNLLSTLLLSFCILICNGQNSTSLAESMNARAARFKIDKNPAALGISSAVQARISSIKNPPLNIAVFGVDRRNKHAYGNADMIMIVSIDQLTKKIKISSILRDTYLNIEGRGMDKINSAFFNGGPQLAIKTINENFSLDIQDYVSIDFFGSAKVIDALGGVTLDVKKEEISHLNNYLSEIAAIEMIDPVKVINPGMQKLNGRQTVAYSRIRAIGDDYERTGRQRVVAAQLLDKLRDANPETFSSLALNVLPDMETSMSKMTLLGLGSGIINSKNKDIIQARFPSDANSKGVTINGIWYLSTDLQKTTADLHSFIYPNNQP